MFEGMITNRMSFSQNLLEQVRVLSDVVSNAEKSSFGSVLL
jgi:hypothetical protein